MKDRNIENRKRPKELNRTERKEERKIINKKGRK